MKSTSTGWGRVTLPEKQREGLTLQPPPFAFSPDYPLAFWSLMFLLFIIYIAPQAIYSFLEPLHLAKVSAGLAIVAYVISALGRNASLLAFDQEVKLILLYVGVAILSIPMSVWPGGSWTFFLDIYSKSVIVFFLVLGVMNSERRSRQLLWGLTLFSIFNAWQAVNHYLHGEFFANQRVRGGFSGISNDPNDLSLSLNLAIPFMIYLYETSERSFQKVFAGSAIVVSTLGIVVTFSRGGFLALLGLFCWFLYVRSKKRGMSIVMKGMLVLLIFVAVAPAGYGDRILSIVDSSKDEMGTASVRSMIMKQAIVIAVTHPLGAGLKMHNLILHDTGFGWAGVHSVFLEIAADLGLCGGVLFCVIYLRLIKRMIAIRRVPSMYQTSTLRLAEATEISLVTFGVGGMFLPVAYHTSFYILAGMCLAVKRMADAERAYAVESGLVEAKPNSPGVRPVPFGSIPG